MVPPDLIRCTSRTEPRPRQDRSTPAPACLITRRAEIDDGALADKGLEIAWAKDPVELFFVEIQGSGRVVLADGTACGSATRARTASITWPSAGF